MADSLKIRSGQLEDAPVLAGIEASSYPAAEAADLESIQNRLQVFKDRFWVLEKDGQILSFINGMLSSLPDLKDEMYENTAWHEQTGDWQMIFSVVTHPDYRYQHLASRVMEQVIKDCQQQGLQGIVLTCKDQLIPFYARFGFQDEGISASTHGNVQWHQMRLIF